MTTLIKLGGSLVTDKRQAKVFRRDVVGEIADQLVRIRARQPQRRLVLGHGSGSYGHFEAQKHNTIRGVRTAAERLGLARVGLVATELSQLILAELIAAGLPAVRFQPSSFLAAKAGRIHDMKIGPLSLALEQNLIPLIHGDIAIDQTIGGTIISTEAIFSALARRLPVDTVLLLGDLEGVLDSDRTLIPKISPGSVSRVYSALGESSGVDVTGGMRQKVRDMIALVTANPSLTVHIANGNRDNVLLDLLINRRQIGTMIRSDAAATGRRPPC